MLNCLCASLVSRLSSSVSESKAVINLCCEKKSRQYRNQRIERLSKAICDKRDDVERVSSDSSRRRRRYILRNKTKKKKKKRSEIHFFSCGRKERRKERRLPARV